MANDLCDHRRPLLLKGEEKDAIWGGQHLYTVNGGAPRRIAEIWAMSVRDDVNTRIDGGEYDGDTLAAYIQKQGGEVVAPNYRAGDHFPLLIKLLDSAQPLSIQVHPDDDYSHEKGLDSGKSEMWYVLSADVDASLIYDMKPSVTADEFADAAREGDILSVVATRQATKGDVLYVPAGLVHALGGGVTVAEIQQNADVTYRLYDYERTDKDGNRRELHLDDGLAVVRPYGEEAVDALRFACANEEPTEQLLADTEVFRTYLVSEGEAYHGRADSYYRAILTLDEVTLVTDDDNLKLPRYRAVFIPAKTGKFTVKGHALVIDTDKLLSASDLS